MANSRRRKAGGPIGSSSHIGRWPDGKAAGSKLWKMMRFSLATGRYFLQDALHNAFMA
jgi:hypothetical protein